MLSSDEIIVDQLAILDWYDPWVSGRALNIRKIVAVLSNYSLARTMIITNIDPIVAFYLDSKQLREQLGFSFRDVMSYSDLQLETQHDYIQWLFPTEEPSQFNPDAPTVMSGTFYWFNDLDIVRNRMYEAYRKMVDFYFTGGRGWDQWVTPNNHNFLRITRIIKSLKLFGFENQAHDFYDRLEGVLSNSEFNKIIGEETQKYWKDAIEN